MKKKLHLIVFIAFLMLPISFLSFQAENVQAVDYFTSIEWQTPNNDYYLYTAGTQTFSIKAYWTDDYNQFIGSVMYQSMRYSFDGGAYDVAGNFPGVIVSAQTKTDYPTQEYTLITFNVNTTYFSVGEHQVDLLLTGFVGAMNVTDSTLFFRRHQTYNNNAPIVTVNSPNQNQMFNVSEGTITSSITVDDDLNSLASITVKWDGVAQYVWSYPLEGTFTHDFTVTQGVTTNGTHTITWDVIDSVTWNTSQDIDIVIYDAIIMIHVEEPSNYITRQEPQFRVDFSTDDDLDGGFMYILGVDFENSANRSIVITDVDSFWGYIQNISISDNYRIQSFDVSFSDIYKWMEETRTDDSGSLFATSGSSWYIDDNGEGWYVFTEHLKDGFDWYNNPTITSQDDGLDPTTLAYLENENILDSGLKDSNRISDLQIDDNGTRYTVANDYLVDDSGNRYYEFTDESEHIVDSGDYYNAILSYEEDDMSQQPTTSSFSSYKEIVISNPTDETLTNLIAYVSVTYESDMQADFDDVAFYDSVGTTLLDFDKGEYTASTDADFWVEIPSISDTGTYTTRMYYGNATMSSLEDEAGTYENNNIDLVLHMNDDDDSSSNNYDFTETGDGVSWVSGIIGDGCQVAGSQDYLARTATSAKLDSYGTDWTVSLWYRSETASTDLHSFLAGDVGDMAFCVNIASGDDTLYSMIDGEQDTQSVSGMGYQVWNHITYTHTGGTLYYYLDGVLQGSDSHAGNWNTANEDYYIGVFYDIAMHDSTGIYDEMMLSDDRWTTDYITVYYELMTQDASYISIGSEEFTEPAWNVGEYFDWAVGSGAVGERNDTTMTFWDTADDGYAYVSIDYASLQNIKLHDDNYAISYEVRIATETITKLDAVSFFIYGIAGYGLKMAIDNVGWLYAGASNQVWNINSLAGYSSQDISWTGDWITLNITILGHSKVLYYYNDVLFRDSVADASYFDYASANCGDVYLATDNEAGQTDGELTIDYYQTSYFSGGRISSDGLLYYEYSDPSCTRYNDSWFLSSQIKTDVSSLYSNWGAGTWHSYRYNEHMKYSTRIRFDNEIEYKYWSSFGLSLGATSNSIHIRMRDDIGSAKVNMVMGNHTYGGYATIELSDYVVIDPFDGDWHIFTIEYHHNSFILGTIDGVTVANITYALNPEWFEFADPSDNNAGIASWGVGNGVTGNYNAYMEIDYFYVYNYTYNWWTTSEGWDWNYWSLDGERTTDGELIMTDAGNDYHGFYNFNRLYPLTMNGGGEATKYMLQIRVKMNDTETDYEYISLMTKIGDNGAYYTANIMLWQNDTATISIFDNYVHAQVQTCYETAQISYEWVQDQWYNLSLVIDFTNLWVAGIIDGQLVGNITIDSARMSFSEYENGIFIIDGDSSVTAKTCWMDYFQSGWRKDWAWVSSEGWSWIAPYGGYQDRFGGEMLVYDNVASSHGGIYTVDSNLYSYSSGYQSSSTFYWETSLRPNATETKYNYITLVARLGTNYFTIALFANDTLCVGVTNGMPHSTWYSVTQSAVDFVQNQQYYFRIQVGTGSVSYMYSLDGSSWALVRNSTTDYSSYYGYPVFAYVVVDNAAGQSNAFLFMDYFESGNQDGYWWEASEGWEWDTHSFSSTTAGCRNDDGSMYFWQTFDGNHSHLHADSTDIGSLSGLYNYSLSTKLKATNATVGYDSISVSTALNDSVIAQITFYTNNTIVSGLRSSYAGVTGEWYETQINSFDFFDSSWHTIRLNMYGTEKKHQWIVDGSAYSNTTYSAYDHNSFVSFGFTVNNSASYNTSMVAMDYLSGESESWYINPHNGGWWTHDNLTYGDRDSGTMDWYSTNTSGYSEIYMDDANFTINDGTEYGWHSVEIRLNITNLSDMDFFSFVVSSGTKYFKIIIWQNGSITAGCYDDSPHNGHGSYYYYETVNAGILENTWHTYNITSVNDFNAYFYYDDIFIVGRTPGGAIYDEYYYDRAEDNKIYLVIDNALGELNATASLDSCTWHLEPLNQDKYSDKGWEYTAYGTYTDRTPNGYMAIRAPGIFSSNALVAEEDVYGGADLWNDWTFDTRINFEGNSAGWQDNFQNFVGITTGNRTIGFSMEKNASRPLTLVAGVFWNAGGSQGGSGVLHGNRTNMNYATWYNLSMRISHYGGWIAYYIDDVLVRNSTIDLGYYELVPTTEVYFGTKTIDDDYRLWVDYWSLKQYNITNWERSSEGWYWTYLQDSGYRFDTNDSATDLGFFEFWHDTNDGVNTITATATDLDIGTTSQYAVETLVTYTNASSNYDYFDFGAQVFNNVTSIYSAKIRYNFASTKFYCGLHNGTDWFGTPVEVTRSWSQNSYTEFRIQVDRTNGWVCYFVNDTYITNSTTDGSYINMNSYKIDLTVDNDASASNAHIRVNYLKSGWDYKSQWYWSSEGWSYDFVDPFELSGTRSNGTVTYTSTSSDTNAIRINGSNQYTLQQGYNVTTVHTRLRYINTTASYDAIYYSLEVNSSVYGVMRWNQTHLRIGVANSWDAIAWYNYTDVEVTWTQNAWEIFTISANFSAGWIAFYNSSLATSLNYYGENLLGNVSSIYLNAWSGTYLTYLGIDGNSVTQIEFDYIKSGYGYWQLTTQLDVGLSYTYNLTMPRVLWGEDLGITYNSTYSRIMFSSEVELYRYCQYYIIFENYSGATYNDATWTMPTFAWNQLPDGEYTVSLYCSFDTAGATWYNFTMRRDTVAPTLYAYLTPISAVGNVYYADYPPGLYMQILWGANVLDPNYVRIEINDKDIIYEWENTLENKPTDFPSTVTPITAIEGNHTMVIRAIDYAGNQANKTIYFQIIRRKEITFSFVSAGDNIPIHIAELFTIEIDGFPTGGLEGATIYDRFDVGVYDAFMQLIYYQEDVAYARNIQITLSLRRVTLTNLEQVPVAITIQKTTGEIYFTMASDSTKTYYLKDGTYKVVADPKGAMRSNTQQFVATDFSLSVSNGGTNNVDILLEWIEVVGNNVFSLSRVIETMLSIAWTTLGVMALLLIIIFFTIIRRTKRVEDVVTGQVSVKGKTSRLANGERDTSNYEEYGNGKSSKKKSKKKDKKGFFKKLLSIILTK